MTETDENRVMSIPCPTCDAGANEGCSTKFGSLTEAHPSRWEMARYLTRHFEEQIWPVEDAEVYPADLDEHRPTFIRWNDPAAGVDLVISEDGPQLIFQGRIAEAETLPAIQRHLVVAGVVAASGVVFVPRRADQ